MEKNIHALEIAEVTKGHELTSGTSPLTTEHQRQQAAANKH